MEELVLSAILYKDFIELHRERFEFDTPIEKKWKKFFPIPNPNVTHNRERVAIRPDIYAEAIFPLYKYSKKVETVVEEINPWKVIGGHYKTMSYPDYVLDRLNAVFGESPYSPEKAIYYRLEPFGIYVIIEGKNRVKWFRFRNRPIKAEVKVYKYYEPEDLEIV